VTLRALPLLHCLGFRKFELFGFDSCLRDSDHHAYKQAENDGKIVQTVTVSGREFHCQPWMIAQAGDFVRLTRAFGDNFDLLVRGDGLISHIIKSAAEGN
jgi:hypothetical protein